MAFDLETLKAQIPYYLTAEDQQVLVRELGAISRGGEANYFLSASRDTFNELMLQGDGWRGLHLFLFNSGERRLVKGLILSNSCDVDPCNPRDIPTRVIFAPLVRLAAYSGLLSDVGIARERIEAKIVSIRAQKTTNVFYLPAGGPLNEDYIVRLDEAHSMPVAALLSSSDREKLFTLSNTGFYMLVFKLSIHFCRLHENINRGNIAVPS